MGGPPGNVGDDGTLGTLPCPALRERRRRRAQRCGQFEESSFLLYLAITYGVQNYVVHLRARPLWDALGPQAGSGLQINFGQGPEGAGAFFATFRGGPGFGQDSGPGFGPSRPGSPPGTERPRQNDPTIIDVEVVEDDDEPPALH